MLCVICLSFRNSKLHLAIYLFVFIFIAICSQQLRTPKKPLGKYELILFVLQRPTDWMVLQLGHSAKTTLKERLADIYVYWSTSFIAKLLTNDFSFFYPFTFYFYRQWPFNDIFIIWDKSGKPKICYFSLFRPSSDISRY